MERLEDVLDTAKKHMTFCTPAKHLTTENILDKISLLDTAQSLRIDVIELELDTKGGGVVNHLHPRLLISDIQSLMSSTD